MLSLLRLFAAFLGWIFGFLLGVALLEVSRIDEVDNRVIVVLLLATACGILGFLGVEYVTVRPARWLLALLDWVPARLTALSFAIVGDFEDAAYCWRMQAKSWPETEGGEPIGIVLASGAGALGIQIGGPLQQLGDEPYFRPELGVGESVQSEVLPSAVGLVWRALVLWLLILLLITLANWAP